MISYIRGTLVEKGLDRVVLETDSGIAYEARIPESDRASYPDSGDTLRLHTHLHVREDEMTLYGFLNRPTRDFFRQLLPQKGIGPKLALSAVSELGMDQFRRAIYDQDLDRLKQISGVGEKTARRLVVEMADRLPEDSREGGVEHPRVDEAVQALIGLGFRKSEASGAVRKAAQEDKVEQVEELITKSLEYLEASG